MPSTCVFEFDRPDPIYYSGEIINGRINLHTISEKSCREVYINFHGEAKTRWEERKSRTRNGKTEHYTEYYNGHETYIQSRTNVFPEGVLPPGHHIYTFNIPLPIQAPSSCNEKYGHIMYEISLVIDRPFKFDNTFRQPLTVLKQLNLNLSPEYLIPIQGEDIKYFCCWPCSSGPVISNLHIPFGGYAPGQVIRYSLHIDNQSAKYDLDGIHLKFVQTYNFTAHTPRHKTRKHSVVLAEKTQEETVLRLTKRILEGTLLIPPVPPTSVDYGLIRVDYAVQMDIKTGGCHTDSEILIPLTVGTIPLVQSAENPENIALYMPTAPTPDTPGYDPNLPPSYDTIKPPSFEEATSITDKFIDSDVDERNRVDGFIPKYPMYTNFAIPTAPPPATENIDDAPSAPLLGPPPLGSHSAQILPYPSGNIPNVPYPTGSFANAPNAPGTTAPYPSGRPIGWKPENAS